MHRHRAVDRRSADPMLFDYLTDPSDNQTSNSVTHDIDVLCDADTSLITRDCAETWSACRPSARHTLTLVPSYGGTKLGNPCPTTSPTTSAPTSSVLRGTAAQPGLLLRGALR